MSKLFAALLIAILIALPACGGGDDDDDDAGSVDDVETCEQLADLTIDEVQIMLNGLSDMDVNELQQAMQSGELPEPITDFESQQDDFVNKADELNCEEQEFLQLLDDRADDLEADGPIAEQLLNEIQSGSFFQDLQ